MLHVFRRCSLFAVVCAGAVLAPRPVLAVAPQITHHDLEITLDPDTHWLSATDRLQVVWDPGGGRPLNFLLSDALKVEQIHLDDGQSLDWTVSAALGGNQQVTVLLPPTAPRQVQVRIKYRGAIAHEVERAQDLAFVAGDRTEGTIDSAGVYLTENTGWIPASPEELATYRLSVLLPEEWEVCTQGKFLGVSQTPHGKRSEWLTTVPSDGLALVAGRYVVERRMFGPTVIATYLFPDHADASEMLAKASAEYLDRFSELLGPYPFPEFAIVENFFSSGFAFPGYTLLGEGVLAQPARLLRPGYLDHEIVHNWWGNGVFVDEREGNWAEALTTYYANYLAHERQGADAAATYRRRALVRFAVHAPVGADYPLGLFQTKTSKLDDAVGYTKGSMVFHLLRRAVGDEVFFPVMREVAQAHVGTRAGWSTFITALAQQSGQPLERWTGQWLHRTGAPDLRLDKVEVRPTDTGYRIEGTVVQQGDPYTLTLPLRVDTTQGPVSATLPLREVGTRFSLAVDGMPVAVRIDPDAEVFRRLSPAEQPPCLNRTLYSDQVLCIYPEDPRDPRNVQYRRLAERAAAERQGLAVPVSEVTTHLLEGRSVLLFGYGEGHPRLTQLLAEAAGVVTLEPTRFTLGGQAWEAPTDAVLVSVALAADPARTLTVYAGNGAEALERADLLFFYGWDSVIRFAAARAVERYDLTAERGAAAWDGVAYAGGAPDPDALRRTVTTLADPWLLGRQTGQLESGQVQHHLITRFQEAGLVPVERYVQEFPLQDPHPLTPQPAVRLTARNDEHLLSVWPVWWSSDAPVEGDVMFAGYGWADSTWNDYRRQRARGRIVVVFGGGPPGASAVGPLEALRAQALAAQERGASGLLVVVPHDELSTYLPAIALPYPLLPWPEPESPRGSRDGPQVQPALALRAAQLRTRAPAPAVPLDFPVWIMPWDESVAPSIGPLELQAWRNRLASGRSATVGRVRRTRLTAPVLWTPGDRQGVNILGVLEGTDPQLRDEVIVIGAHYDHLGLADTGEVFRGADDNASGVAALLAAVEHLATRKAELRRTVCFVAFDAEEWGLQGSRAFVAADLLAPKRIVAMLNADSVGRNVGDRVFLVGGPTHPQLGKPAAQWAEMIGLHVGRDIDQFAYPGGSDHWPFAEAGIPALTLFASDYANIDSVYDVPEALDYAHVGRVTQLLTALAYQLATQPLVPAGVAPDPATPAE